MCFILFRIWLMCVLKESINGSFYENFDITFMRYIKNCIKKITFFFLYKICTKIFPKSMHMLTSSFYFYSEFLYEFYFENVN